MATAASKGYAGPFFSRKSFVEPNSLNKAVKYQEEVDTMFLL